MLNELSNERMAQFAGCAKLLKNLNEQLAICSPNFDPISEVWFNGLLGFCRENGIPYSANITEHSALTCANIGGLEVADLEYFPEKKGERND